MNTQMKYILYVLLCLPAFSTITSPLPLLRDKLYERGVRGVQEFQILQLIVDQDDSILQLENGIYFYNNLPFSGYILSKYENGSPEEKSGYLNGKKEGISLEWFPNGSIRSERFYTNGEKNGIHYGWYENGSIRFQYSFKNGVNEGISTEWYRDGMISRQTVYSSGNEVSAKAWGVSGKLYINYEVRDGVIFGLNNSVPCYSIKNGKGEYVSAK